MMGNREIIIYSKMSELDIIKRMDECKKTFDYDYYSYLMQLLNNVRVAKVLSCKYHKTITDIPSKEEAKK